MTLPPTQALYQQSSLTLTFSGQVLASHGTEVALDTTAFYPEGGGQNSDTGWLHWENQRSRVQHTRKDKPSGVIWHLVDGGLPPVGAMVQGEVDSDRRWRHMQRHSAEHLLAQAFRRVNPAFQVAAVSMSSPECHLDLLGHPSEEDIQAAEALLREVLGRTDLHSITPIVLEEHLAQYPLRRETKVRGQVRLVLFQDDQGVPFDVSACGGTHLPRAGQCAPVVVLRTERIKSGLTRVVFTAGEEAGAYLSGVYRDARRLAQQFSVPVERLPERVAALSAEMQQLKQDTEHLRRELARHLIQVTPVQQVGLTLRTLKLNDPELLLPVLTQVPDGEVIVATTPAGRCGISSAHPSFPAGELLRRTLAHTGGKGGGKADLAQGQTLQPEHFLAIAARVIHQGAELLP